MSSADSSRRVGLVGSLLGLACVLGLVEAAMLPPLPLPGVRLGLANIAVLVAVVAVGLRWALLVSLVRVVLVGALTGTLGGPTTLLGLAGAVAAWAVIAVLRVMGRRFSVVGWSIGAAAAHVVAQVGLVAVLMGHASILLLAPYSLAVGALCGLATGVTTHVLISRLSAPLHVSVRLARGSGAHEAAASG